MNEVHVVNPQEPEADHVAFVAFADKIVAEMFGMLHRMGQVEEHMALLTEEQRKEYVRHVCSLTAGFVGTMPAVQIAMRAANPDLDELQLYRKMARAICGAFGLDPEPILQKQFAGPLAGHVTPRDPTQN